MKLTDFNYELPEELIAQSPIEKRDNSRLMVLNTKTKTIEHKIFKDIIDYLEKGDCLVINNTKVIPARLYGYKKEDESKTPVMFVYFDSKEFGRKFYYADKAQGQFIEMPTKEFEKRFECYDKDLEKNHGHKLWEEEEKNQNTNLQEDIYVSKGEDR